MKKKSFFGLNLQGVERALKVSDSSGLGENRGPSHETPAAAFRRQGFFVFRKIIRAKARPGK